MKILLLILATAIWGLGFVGSRWTFELYDPIWSNCLRYVFAAIITLPFLLKWKSFNKSLHDYKVIGVSAFLLMGGLQTQTIGIAHTSLAKSGFFTTFYALFVPIICILLYGYRYRKSFWGILLLAFFGLALLCELEWQQFNYGDVFIFISALFFSAHILVVDKVAEDYSPVEFNFLQCFLMGVMGLAFGLIWVGPPPHLYQLFAVEALTRPSALYGFIILSLFSSLVAFTIQIYAQKDIPAHIVGLIFLGEAVFSSLFGFIYFAESLSTLQIIGCIFIALAMGLVPKFTKHHKLNHGESIA